MKKQILVLFLLICLSVCLRACGDGEASRDGGKADSTSGVDISGDNTSGENISGVSASGEDDVKENSAEPEESAKNLTAFERLFSNGPIPAQDKNELWGYIDDTGEWVISPSFTYAGEFRYSGMAAVQEGVGQLFGIIDASGEYVVEPIFDNISTDTSQGLPCVHLPERGWGYIDASGEFVTEPQSFTEREPEISAGGNSVVNWNSDLIPVLLRDGTGYVYKNKDGDQVLPKSGAPYAYAFYFSFDGLAAVAAIEDDEMRLGFIDQDGNWVIPPQYDWKEHDAFCNGYALVETAPGQTAIIDASGDILMTTYGDIRNASLWTPERILVKNYENVGTVKSEYYSIDGQLAIDCIFGNARDFAHDYSYAKVEYEGLWGFIDKDGNWLIPAKFLPFDRSVLLF